MDVPCWNHFIVLWEFGGVSRVAEKFSRFLRCILTPITFVLFIGFEHMNNGWKVEGINYNIGVVSSLRSCLDWSQKDRFFRLLNSVQRRISAVPSIIKNP